MIRVTIGQGDKVLGYLSWLNGQYVVKGEGMSSKDLSVKLRSLEHYSGMSGEALLKHLPDYFAGSDKWAKLAE